MAAKTVVGKTGAQRGVRKPRRSSVGFYCIIYPTGNYGTNLISLLKLYLHVICLFLDMSQTQVNVGLTIPQKIKSFPRQTIFNLYSVRFVTMQSLFPTVMACYHQTYHYSFIYPY